MNDGGQVPLSPRKESTVAATFGVVGSAERGRGHAAGAISAVSPISATSAIGAIGAIGLTAGERARAGRDVRVPKQVWA